MAYTSTLQKLAESLRSTFEHTIFSNSVDVGNSREKALIEYLKKVMASRYGFSSGEVFDEADSCSGQVDVIIFDNLFSTIFTDGSGNIFAPVESTFGIISVKSKMGLKELKHAVDGILRYNSLIYPTAGGNTLQILPDLSFNFSEMVKLNKSDLSEMKLNCIFAYDSKLSDMAIVREMRKCQCLDLLVIPGRCCIVGRKRSGFSMEDLGFSSNEYVSITTENSVGLFVLFLQIHLSRNVLKARDVESLVVDIIRQGKLTVIE